MYLKPVLILTCAIIILVICYNVFSPALFPISLFVVVIILTIYAFVSSHFKQNVVDKYEKMIFKTDDIGKNIQTLENGEYITNIEEKKIAKDIVKKYKKNSKYIEEKDNKI